LLNQAKTWALGLTLPAGAIGVELDLTAADLDTTILSAATLGYAWLNLSGGSPFLPYTSFHPITLEGHLIPTSDWIPGGAQVDPRTPFPAGGSYSTLFSDSVNGATPDNSVSGSLDITSDLADAPFGAYYHGGALAVLLMTGAEATGTEPSDDTIFTAADANLSLTFDWQPPSWRPLFKANQLPLRQFPRDDPIGGSPRQDRSSTSTNVTARQGWTNTYR
jgi:hypothetical protein